MTTVHTPAPSAAPSFAAPAAPRLVRWLLRLHRPALIVWAVLVVVGAAVLLWLRGPLTDAAATAWQQYDRCTGAGPCGYDQAAIIRYKDVYSWSTSALFALPFVVAAWAGASLIGRELESGTAQLAWTQGASPARWLAAKLAVPAALITAGTGLLVVLHRLAWSAAEGRIDTAKSWYDTWTYATNGPVLVALALAGLAVGALAGLLQRLALPALAASFVVTGALWDALAWVLPYLWPPVTRTSSLTAGPAGSGIDVDHGLVTAGGAHTAVPDCGTDIGGYQGCPAAYDKLHAVGFYHRFHPESHFWPLQLVEAGLLLAVAALLVLATFRLLRHRTAAVGRLGRRPAA
ncbi:ABC transporter permease [Streptomyces sp. NPDC006739]|uniref:ABC transporter permease n=1 Tax=Streptomyces sp. NPDC006739 TaxID=3364763 RepID=UPI00369AFDA9